MKLTNCSIRQFAALASLLVLAGCQASPARVELQRVNVPLPVACDEPMPERPGMPTEQLRLGATVDQFTQAAQAEIERREAYETRLAAALGNCIRPISPSRPAAVIIAINFDYFAIHGIAVKT